MPKDQFLHRKVNQLKKNDKSIKDSWDKPIVKLCNLINKKNNYYTTSSCSGRALLLVDCKEKRDDLFIKVWHDLINFEKLKKELEDIKSKKLIYFKQDPCILHVACKTLEDAQAIHDKAKLAGWKRCGIIGSKKRFVVELNATEKLEFPIVDRGKVLAEDDFLKVIVREANKKFKISWDKIKKLESDLK